MRYESAVTIEAPAEEVWRVLAEVRRWPEWTPTVTEVEILDERGAFGVGTRVRLVQPRLRPAIWEVTEYTPGRSFTWVSHGPGVRSVGEHRLTTDATGVRYTLAIEQRGPLEPVIRLFFGGLIRRYVATEGESLKRRCESPAGSG